MVEIIKWPKFKNWCEPPRTEILENHDWLGIRKKFEYLKNKTYSAWLILSARIVVLFFVVRY